MNPYLLATLAVVAAYLIGAIPFGYLTALWARGVDIRTVGSGNIGATNVGRVLGFRFFVIVFLLDLLKGFLPTYFFPKLVSAHAGDRIPELGVLVALAAILGHNFPIYLKLKGGKGVATSLGALLALDWFASVAAAFGFLTFLQVTRYVSLSSLCGGLVFVAAHFARTPDPWSRGQRAMSVVSLGLLGLLFVRHRQNIGRLWAGTEPKGSLHKQRPPAGYIAWRLIVVLALVALAVVYGVGRMAARRSELALGAVHLLEVERVGTGYQRTERVAFAEHGTLLAVTCPRYNRLVVYRVTASERLDLVADIELQGRPMAVCATGGRFWVLERPAGDARHVEPGWCEAFDDQGRPIGSRFLAGMYPDDFAVTADGKYALILTSGRAEGDPRRPEPGLDVWDLGAVPPRIVSGVCFHRPADDPCRIVLSATGRFAAVSLLGSDQVAALDLEDLKRPRLIGRTDFPTGPVPYLSASEDDRIVMATAPERDAVVFPWPGSPWSPLGCLACADLRGRGLTFVDAATHRFLGRFPLRGGALNLSVAQPMGLAYAAERGLLAVASRSGSVHLIAVRDHLEAQTTGGKVADAGRGNVRR